MVVVGKLGHQVPLIQLQHIMMHVKNPFKSSIVTKCHLPVSASDKVAFSSSHAHQLPVLEEWAASPLSVSAGDSGEQAFSPPLAGIHHGVRLSSRSGQ